MSIDLSNKSLELLRKLADQQQFTELQEICQNFWDKTQSASAGAFNTGHRCQNSTRPHRNAQNQNLLDDSHFVNGELIAV